LSSDGKAGRDGPNGRRRTLGCYQVEVFQVQLSALPTNSHLEQAGRCPGALNPVGGFPMVFRFPFERVNWQTSAFLIGTFALTITAVPFYLIRFGIDWFQATLFGALLIATGFSITLGYHRLFSHLAFRASFPVKLFVLIFGAAAFENSVLMWTSEHRRHHKHVDHEEDPYDISKGFFHAHIGWLLFKLLPQPPFDNVSDLKKDPLVMWQHRYIHTLSVLVSFVLPTLVGAMWNGWAGALGGFLISGVAKIVVLQHCTFLINSACHTIGRQPYSVKCSARDSLLMAFLTFGEGYHNYHHEFQHDYRNGVKAWQWDPTKWLIWIFSKLGLTKGLRRVPRETIHVAETRLRVLLSEPATATARRASSRSSERSFVSTN
jgi:stearoyl-CoA desaturase (Delta-9 desaturase)